jgi:hypothetical protein
VSIRRQQNPLETFPICKKHEVVGKLREENEQIKARLNLGVPFRTGKFSLTRGLVVAGRAAGFAVQQAVRTQANVDYGLAEAAVLLALTAIFRLFALGALAFGRTGSCTHEINVTRGASLRKMTLVIVGPLEEFNPEVLAMQ